MHTLSNHEFHCPPAFSFSVVDDEKDGIEQLVEVLKGESTIVLETDVGGATTGSNGYGKNGLNVNGQVVGGNGKTVSVTGADSTWDSAINITGGTIKNLTIYSGFRGVFINHNSTDCGNVYLEKVVIDGPVYTISCDQGTGEGLEAINPTFNGWTSYAATIGEVTFIDCSFGEGSGYSFCRPYAPTTFKNCEFEAGFEMDPRAAVTFENCTLDGVAITSDNIATLVTSNIANASVI